MAVGLSNATKSVPVSRTLVYSVVLLALVGVLAGALVHRRAHDSPGGRLTLPGWTMSFRPPKQHVPGDIVQTAHGLALPFHGVTSGGANVILVFRQFRLTLPQDPVNLCAVLVREHPFDDNRASVHSTPTPSSAKLGSVDAVELLVPELSAVARVAVLDGGMVYAVSMAVDRAELDEVAYDIFDSTCRSIKYPR